VQCDKVRIGLGSKKSSAGEGGLLEGAGPVEERDTSATRARELSPQRRCERGHQVLLAAEPSKEPPRGQAAFVITLYGACQLFIDTFITCHASCAIMDAQTKTEAKVRQLAVRFPEVLVARIEHHRALMNEERPGLNVTLSAAIRVLVEQALEFAESAAEARRGQ
jgi:hypothetical protein